MNQTARTELLFAYGTLLEAPVQLRVIGRLVPVAPDCLPGYRTGGLRLSTATYLIAEVDPAGSIEGGVLCVAPSELERIDRYEGVEYERARVRLLSGRVAWVYRRPGGLGATPAATSGGASGGASLVEEESGPGGRRNVGGGINCQ